MPAVHRLPATNRLIAALPDKDRSRLLAACDRIDLKFAQALSVPGERIEYVYFPLDGFISLVTPVDGRAFLEVGLIGNEGMHGVSLALGVAVSPLHALVQGAGFALRMSAADFIREHKRSPALQKTLSHYLYVLMGQLAQSAACTRFHVIEARLARWLLMTQDRAHSNQFHITHAFLAWMLGVRRTGVTKAANGLQNRKLISYTRGHIEVLDRPALEAAACACYAADKRNYDAVFGRDELRILRRST